MAASVALPATFRTTRDCTPKKRPVPLPDLPGVCRGLGDGRVGIEPNFC